MDIWDQSKSPPTGSNKLTFPGHRNLDSGLKQLPYPILQGTHPQTPIVASPDQVTTKAKQVADKSVGITLGSGSKFGFENPFKLFPLPPISSVFLPVKLSIRSVSATPPCSIRKTR